MNKPLSFIIFITIFLALYGFLHLYFYIKLKKAIEIGTTCNLLIIIALFFLLLSPILINSLSKTGNHLLTYILTYAAYTWMGGLFLFFSMNILVDIYRLFVYIAGRIITPSLAGYIPGDKLTFISTLLIIAGIIVYGRFEAENIALTRVELRTTKLPPLVSNLRVVQISDTHFSTLNGVKLSQKIGGIIRDCHPDILVSTGDLIDRGLQDEEAVASVFRDIKTTYGKYAIAGNHEFISGIEKAVLFTEKAGFRMLRNERITIGNFLNIAGVDDPAAKRFSTMSNISENKVLGSLSPDRLNIFLKHQPRIDNNSIGKFDIQLSGHTHNGQIFPFTLIVSLFYPYPKGLSKLSNGCYLYVSSGTGTWGPPFRFLTFPEITVIDFQREEIPIKDKPSK
jgi:predicted MPP superfamily phosphohydrolase